MGLPRNMAGLLKLCAVICSIFVSTGALEAPRSNLDGNEDAEGSQPQYMARRRAGTLSKNFDHCPPEYPEFGRLGEILEAWSPNQPEVPETFTESLRVSVGVYVHKMNF